MWELAQATGLCAASVGCRLAPEHACPRQSTIGGESAGAQLSVVTLLRLGDWHLFTGAQAATLVYGCCDVSMTPG
ncbi:MAG TPA: hypothetical protein VF933_07115 [Streptosporangiaceae bacterium]